MYLPILHSLQQLTWHFFYDLPSQNTNSELFKFNNIRQYTWFMLMHSVPVVNFSLEKHFHANALHGLLFKFLWKCNGWRFISNLVNQFYLRHSLYDLTHFLVINYWLKNACKHRSCWNPIVFVMVFIFFLFIFCVPNLVGSEINFWLTFW